MVALAHNGEGLTYLAHHRHKNNERTWNTSRISRTKNMASYGKPVLAAAFLMFSGHSALGGASPTPRAPHASFRLAGIGMLRCTRRRGANGHGLQAMAFRKTPDTRAVRLTTSRTACTRFFQVAANVELAAVRPCGGLVYRGELWQACVVRRLFIL